MKIELVTSFDNKQDALDFITKEKGIDWFIEKQGLNFLVYRPFKERNNEKPS